jgi:hypothetical protein
MSTTTTITKGTKYPGSAVITPLYEALSDPRGFFESVLGFEKLENKWIRVSFETQRRYFGNTPFGRKAIKIKEDGVVVLYKSQAYGHDWDFIEARYDHNTKGWVHADSREPLGILPGAF